MYVNWLSCHFYVLYMQVYQHRNKKREVWGISLWELLFWGHQINGHLLWELHHQTHRLLQYWYSMNTSFVYINLQPIRFLNDYLGLTGIFVMFLADLWEDSKFFNCKLENTTFLHPKRGCHINFQEENDILIYLVSFLGSLSVIPGNIVAGLLMDKIGRLKIIGEWFHTTVMALSITLNVYIVCKWTVSVFVCRGIHVSLRCLHVLPAPVLQSVGCRLLPVLVLRSRCRSLERHWGRHSGALSSLKKVQKIHYKKTSLIPGRCAFKNSLWKLY